MFECLFLSSIKLKKRKPLKDMEFSINKFNGSVNVYDKSSKANIILDKYFDVKHEIYLKIKDNNLHVVQKIR